MTPSQGTHELALAQLRKISEAAKPVDNNQKRSGLKSPFLVAVAITRIPVRKLGHWYYSDHNLSTAVSELLRLLPLIDCPAQCCRLRAARLLTAVREWRRFGCGCLRNELTREPIVTDSPFQFRRAAMEFGDRHLMLFAQLDDLSLSFDQS